MRAAILLALLALTGCGAYTVPDPITANATMAKCYAGLNNAFCVVQVPKGAALLGGTTTIAGVAGITGNVTGIRSQLK